MFIRSLHHSPSHSHLTPIHKNYMQSQNRSFNIMPIDHPNFPMPPIPPNMKLFLLGGVIIWYFVIRKL